METKSWKNTDRVTLKDGFQGMWFCDGNILWLATYYKYKLYVHYYGH